MIVLHVAGIELEPNSGMGRISFEWKKAFEKRGHTVIHIGNKEISKPAHSLLFGWEVRKVIEGQKLRPDLILAHEPAAGFLCWDEIPLVVFSHGIEERDWKLRAKYGYFKNSLKSKLLPLKLRFLSNNKGFRHASLIMLSNSEDVSYLVNEKRLDEAKIKIFHNGFYRFPVQPKPPISDSILTFLFNATWISRKGIDLVAQAFNEILATTENIRLILAGTKVDNEMVWNSFTEVARPKVNVLSSFNATQEQDLYKSAQVFLMPSYFEGQSLALTQAMAMGLCPVVSDNCGQKDFVTHKENGLVFKTGNIESFLLQVKWLIANQHLIQNMGKKAQCFVENYLWENVSDEIVGWCENIVLTKK